MSKKKRTAGIDYGMARIGIALSDERKILAMPLMTLKAEKKMEPTVMKLMDELDRAQREKECTIDEIVVGMPLMMNGSIGHVADEVKLFIETLKKMTDIPITAWDERLTSVQAERSMIESGMNRKKRAKHVDSVAAVIILQSYLDFKGLEKDES